MSAEYEIFKCELTRKPQIGARGAVSVKVRFSDGTGAELKNEAVACDGSGEAARFFMFLEMRTPAALLLKRFMIKTGRNELNPEIKGDRFQLRIKQDGEIYTAYAGERPAMRVILDMR